MTTPKHSKELVNLLTKLFEKKLNSESDFHTWKKDEILKAYHQSLSEACLNFVD
jgi:hypothetical protein